MEARWPIRDRDKGGRGKRRVKTQDRCQPRSRLLWTTARTTKCYGSVRLALHSNYCTSQLLSQLLCGIVTKSMSAAPPLGNN